MLDMIKTYFGRAISSYSDFQRVESQHSDEKYFSLCFLVISGL